MSSKIARVLVSSRDNLAVTASVVGRAVGSAVSAREFERWILKLIKGLTRVKGRITIGWARDKIFAVGNAKARRFLPPGLPHLAALTCEQSFQANQCRTGENAKIERNVKRQTQSGSVPRDKEAEKGCQIESYLERKCGQVKRKACDEQIRKKHYDKKHWC